MRLTQLFMVTTGVVLTLVSAMLVRSVAQEWRTVNAAESGLQAMELAYQSMKVAEKASFERGPTIAVLGDGDTPDPAKRARLVTAREASDAAFALPLQTLGASSRPEHQAAAALLGKARDQLSTARAEVERVAALANAERTASTTRVTRVPIDQMFAVIDTALEAATVLVTDAERAYPELATPMMGARLAAELREYAGRLGSQFTRPIGAQKALSEAERKDILILIGRITQLRQLLEVRSRAVIAEIPKQRMAEAIAEMQSRYFAVGLPFIDNLTQVGTSGQDYGIDLAQFVARYQPEMASIVKLRDTLFALARDQAQMGYSEARRNLWINSAIGLAVLMIEITVFLLIRKRVLQPLLTNTSAIVAIAEGKLDTPVPHSERRDEIGDMQNAVAVLRKTSVKKKQLESEHQRLIEQLTRASTVDFLTGLLNRREFAAQTRTHLALAKRHDWSVALIVFDVDNFKLVNDQYGHYTGDATLVQIAKVAQREFRESDVLARYGGEEFIALVLDCNAEQAAALAERVRTSIEKAPFVNADGEAFSVTASFGVATEKATAISDPGIFFQWADQALYRAKRAGRNRVSTSTA